MTTSEAIGIMCRRCVNHDVCQGTGCEPKRVLEEAIAKVGCEEAGKEIYRRVWKNE